MPHQCTQCGHTFPDGSKEMLSGCPDCGGNKFQFRPTTDEHGTDTSTPSSESMSASNSPAVAGDKSSEDRAQANAEREASREEPAVGADTADHDVEPVPSKSVDSETESASDSTVPSESDEAANMAALREELDDQFESIKILEPGQYELNLMELYNREEYIIALQEDGQYVIEVPETWLGDDS